MVGYGASLRRARREGWHDAYINYDRLKKILKDINSVYNDLDTVSSTSHHFTPATSYDDAPVATTVGEETSLLETGRPRAPSDPTCTHDVGAATEATDDSTDQKLEDAHRRARELAGKFLDLLHSEVEKVFLFSLARQGEIADAVGSLRYADAPVPLRMSVGTVRSSSLLEFGRESTGDDEKEDEEDEDDGFGTGDIALGETAALLPRTSIRLPSQASPPHAIRKQVGNQERALFQGDGLFTGALNDLDSYSALGVELLHLLRFVCVNAMAVRKILKKHDKLLAQQRLGGYYQSEDAKEKKRHKRDRSKMPFSNPSHRLVGAADVQLQQLANSDSIAGITASLDAALSNLSLSASMNDDPSYVRLECIVSSIHVLRQCAEIVNEPFEAFLSRKAMIATGHELGGLGGSTSRALEVLLCFRPDAILLMNLLDLIEWRQLAEDRTLAYPTMYGREVRSRLLSHTEDWQQPKQMDHHIFGGINTVSMVLNLLSAFLYTVNYYIISPTANHYARQLGSDGAYGATLVGGSSFTAIFAAFIYSFWYTRHTFKSALFFSSFCPVVGNLLYSLAISFDHHKMSVAMAGRLLVGFSSAEVVNRMIISTCVSFQSMTQASALFVSASAVGMSIGPLLAAILDITSGRDTDVDLQLGRLGIVFNNTTSPGFLMAFLWATEMMAVFLFFREPDRINTMSNESRKDASNSPEVGDNSREVESAPLFSTAWSEVKTVSALISNNPALPITLLLFAYIELVDEVLISSCSMVVRRYFGWHGSTAGFLIASLGALVLPSHFVVERASRYYEERSIMKWSVLFIFAGLIGIFNYQGFVGDTIGIVEVEWEDITNSSTDGNNSTDPIIVQESQAPAYDWGAGVYVYLIFLCAIFMGTIVLEGVDTSLMSKVTPAKLNDTFINCGLLATLVGTVGRVLGDGLITVSALIDYLVFTDFLNDTFFPMIPLALLGYWAVRRYFKQLL